MYKRCGCCKNVLPENMFSKRRNRRGEPCLHCWCKPCRKEKEETYRRKKGVLRAGVKMLQKRKILKEKICSKCMAVKNVSEFKIDKRHGTPTGYCRNCNIEYGREYYLLVRKPVEHPEKPKRAVKPGCRWCLKCDEEKKVAEFYANGGNTCKVCANEAQRMRQKKNREHITKKQKEYRKRIGKEVLNKRQQEYRKVNREAQNQWARNTRSRLTDSYIAQNILKPKGIPRTKENIDIARSSLLLKRVKDRLQKTGKKICDHCKKMKDIKDFPVRIWYWKGVRRTTVNNICKPCAYEKSKSYRRKKNV